MNRPVGNSSKSNKTPFTSPANHTVLSSAFLLCGYVLLVILLTASIYFLQKPTLYVVLIGFCFVLFLLMAYQSRKIYSELEQFHAVLKSFSNPVHVTDGSGVTRYANPAFLNWSGMNQSSVIGQNLFDLMKITAHTGNKESIWSSAKLALLSGKEWRGEVEFSRTDGQIAIAELNLLPVLDANGKLFECFALHRDLAEKKEFTRKMIGIQLQFSSIVESSLDGIMVVQNERLVYVNPSAVSLFGYISAEEMQSLKFTDTVAPQSKPFLTMTPDGRTAGEEVLRNYELRGLTKQGKIIDLEANAHVIAWNDHPAVQASFRNITKRKMLEREQTLWLLEQETLSDIDRKLVGVVDLNKIFAAILQQTLNLTRAHFGGILLFDELHLHLQWNSICGNTLQHTAEMFQPNETLLDIFKNEEPLIIQNSSTSTRYPLSQLSIVGEEKLISSAWLPLKVDGKCKGMLVVGYQQYHDYAGREMRLLISLAEKNSIAMVNAQLYTDLLQREKELEILSSARVQAQEDERRRIAREIHDGLGQMLTAIKFNLEILEDMITAGKDERERIDDMKNLLDSVMKEAREISYNLMPSVLDDFGLAPALQLLSEQFSNRTDVKVQFQAHGITGRLDSNLEIGLYRIAQESLNNVSKHAEATEVNLQIIRHSNGIRLVIEDNGKGITNQSSLIRATGKGGMGLPGMRERASSIGGALTIDSTPNNGTLITVEVPLIKSNTHE
jgi:PAS domain S-box-containing protein